MARVLLIDDDPAVLKLIVEMLKTKDYEVVTAPDGSRLNISCRIREGEEMPIRGDEIVLVKYIPPSNQRRSGYFEVVKVDAELC